ncbi:MAG: hypothetical protein CR980_00625 [Propionibacteriales bacterium]|nr:MAG: hypothetical protein CR980_00625 [Propionibacteriales bacterium]
MASWLAYVAVVPLAIATALTGSCDTPNQAAPPAVISTAQPPWPAPRDGVNYFKKAHLVAEPLGVETNQRVFKLVIEIDGKPVAIPPYIGVDRPRALQVAVHTHEDNGDVWLEGTEVPSVTLGQFFTVWGIRFDEKCVGGVCGEIQVRADGAEVADPAALKLATIQRDLHISVTSA